MNKPIIGITIGDGAGIGVEITLKMIRNENIFDLCIPVIIGDKRVIDLNLDLLGIDLSYNLLTDFNTILEDGNLYLHD